MKKTKVLLLVWLGVVAALTTSAAHFHCTSNAVGNTQKLLSISESFSEEEIDPQKKLIRELIERGAWNDPRLLKVIEAECRFEATGE